LKYKQILIFFYAVYLLSFAFIFFLPVSVLGWEWTLSFWGRNWFWIIIFTVILVVSWVIFSRRFEYQSLIEKEDWKGLFVQLDKKLNSKKRMTQFEIRLYVLSSFLTDRIEKIGELEEILKNRQYSSWLSEGLLFTIPLWIKKLSGEEAPEFERQLEFLNSKKSRVSHQKWVQWSLAFLLLYANSEEKEARAVNLLLPLLKDKSLLSLCAALLVSARRPKFPELVAVKKNWSGYSEEELVKKWNKLNEDVLYTIILSPLFDKCIQWLKSEGERS